MPKTNKRKKLLRKLSKKDVLHRRCELCKTYIPEDKMVYDSIPFNSEVYGDKEKFWICNKCYDESSLSI